MSIRVEDLGTKHESGFHFGTSKGGLLAALKRLVSEVEDGKALLQSISLTHDAKIDAWTETTIAISYVEREHGYTDQEKRLMALATSSQIPGVVAVPPEEIHRGLGEPFLAPAP